jgi:hypothetical protein
MNTNNKYIGTNKIIYSYLNKGYSVSDIPNICRKSTKFITNMHRIYIHQVNWQNTNIFEQKIQNICNQMLNIHLLIWENSNNPIYSSHLTAGKVCCWLAQSAEIYKLIRDLPSPLCLKWRLKLFTLVFISIYFCFSQCCFGKDWTICLRLFSLCMDWKQEKLCTQ